MKPEFAKFERVIQFANKYWKNAAKVLH